MKVRLGELEVHVLRASRFRLDGGAMFGVVPKVLWERVAPPDERNRIRLACNCLYFRTAAGKHAVVDTGMGAKWDAKGTEMYAVEDDPGISGALGAIDIRPGQIDFVLNTHLHFDHCGGNTRREGADGKLVPTFPNARYIVQRDNLEQEALQPNEMRRASYLPENFQPLLETERFDFLSGKYGEVIEGVSFVVTGGHQKFHTMFIVNGGARQKLAFPADLIPTAAHVNPAWIMAYDHFPAETLAVKKRVLAQAAEERWILVLEHEPERPVGRVAKDGTKFRWEPLEA